MSISTLHSLGPSQSRCHSSIDYTKHLSLAFICAMLTRPYLSYTKGGLPESVCNNLASQTYLVWWCEVQAWWDTSLLWGIPSQMGHRTAAVTAQISSSFHLWNTSVLLVCFLLVMLLDALFKFPVLWREPQETHNVFSEGFVAWGIIAYGSRSRYLPDGAEKREDVKYVASRILAATLIE